MANYSYTIQRTYLYDNVKSHRAWSSLSNLPFVNTTVESSLFKLLNPQNIELDRIRDSIRDSSLEVNPATTDYSLPDSVYVTRAIIENSSDEGVVSRDYMHYGAPTSFISSVDTVYTPSYDILDIHYLSPVFFKDSTGNIVSQKEAYSILIDSADGWFGQEIKIVSLDFTTEYYSTGLPFSSQDMNSLNDEWISLDEAHSYTFLHSYIQETSVRLIDALASTQNSIAYIPQYIENLEVYACDEDISGHTTQVLCDAGAAEHANGLPGHWLPTLSQVYSITGNTVTILVESYYNVQMIVEYNYSPASQLKSFTYSEELFSVLKNSRNNRNFLYLTTSETSRSINSSILENRLLFKQHEIQVGGVCEGTVIINKLLTAPVDTQLSESIDPSNNQISGVSIIMPTDWVPGTITSLLIGDTETLKNPAWTIIETDTNNDFGLEDDEIFVYKYGIDPILLNDGTEINTGEVIEVNILYNKEIIINSVNNNNTAIASGDQEYTIQNLSYEYAELIIDESAEDIPTFTYINADLTVNSNPHHSLMHYPYIVHFEEEDFGLVLISLNHSDAGSYIEKYNSTGVVQYRIPVDLDSIAIVKYKTEIAILVDTVDNFHIDYYKVDDLSFARTINLDETNVPGTYSNICLTLLKDHTIKLIFIGTDGDKEISICKHIPIYDHKCAAPFSELTQYGYPIDPLYKYYFYRVEPSTSSLYDSSIEEILDPDKALVEHSLDQWGRIFGNERWDDESLVNYSNRLTNISKALGNTSMQKSIDGISATFNLDTYNINKQLVYSLNYPIVIIEETLSSEVVNEFLHQFHCPTLLSTTLADNGIISVRLDDTDITSEFNTGVSTSFIQGTDSPVLDYTKLNINPYSDLGLGDQTNGLTTSFDIKIKYRPLTSYTDSDSNDYIIGDSNTNSTKIIYQDQSNFGLIEFDKDELFSNESTITVKYYTNQLTSSFYVESVSLVGRYFYVEEEITIINEDTYDPASHIKIVSLLDKTTLDYSIPTEYQAALTEATKSLKFKWGDGTIASENHAFTWDDYWWADGENIQTGIPTLYFEDGMTDTVDFTAGTSNKSLSLLSKNLTLDNKIKIHTGSFYYDDRECFLYPNTIAIEEDITYDIEGTSLTRVPIGASPSTMRDDMQSTWNVSGAAPPPPFGPSGETIRPLVDSDIMVEQYPYINSTAQFIRPMVKFPDTIDISDISNLINAPMDTTDNSYWILDQTNDLPKIFTSYDNGGTFTFIYGTHDSHEIDVPIEITPSLNINKKILCIGDDGEELTELILSASQTLYSDEDITNNKIITLFIQVKDAEHGYMKNIQISTDITSDYSWTPDIITNNSGLAVKKIDISTVPDIATITDFTVVVNALQVGTGTILTENITLTKFNT